MYVGCKATKVYDIYDISIIDWFCFHATGMFYVGCRCRQVHASICYEVQNNEGFLT